MVWTGMMQVEVAFPENDSDTDTINYHDYET
jgi:hypothetical protein